MTRGTAMLLAPHASRLHSLMAASPPHVVLAILGAVLAVFLIWTVTTVNPRRSR
jgi:hypothetical protein